VLQPIGEGSFGTVVRAKVLKEPQSSERLVAKVVELSTTRVHTLPGLLEEIHINQEVAYWLEGADSKGGCRGVSVHINESNTLHLVALYPRAETDAEKFFAAYIGLPVPLMGEGLSVEEAQVGALYSVRLHESGCACVLWCHIRHICGPHIPSAHQLNK
jgi:hypothetical protein